MHICIYCKMISAIRLVNTSNASYNYTCVYVVITVKIYSYLLSSI